MHGNQRHDRQDRAYCGRQHWGGVRRRFAATSCADIIVIAVVSLSTFKGCSGCGKTFASDDDKMGQQRPSPQRRRRRSPGGANMQDSMGKCHCERLLTMFEGNCQQRGQQRVFFTWVAPFTMAHRDGELQTVTRKPGWVPAICDRISSKSCNYFCHIYDLILCSNTLYMCIPCNWKVKGVGQKKFSDW